MILSENTRAKMFSMNSNIQDERPEQKLLTALILSDGDQEAAEYSATSASALADDVVILERSEVDWTDNTITQREILSMSTDWILVLGAGEQLRFTSTERARAILQDTNEEFFGLQTGLGAEIRIHRANHTATSIIGTASEAICRELSIAPPDQIRTQDSPAVTVIIPTFNRPAFLKRCLEGLCVQTTDDFEVIVVNDGGLNVSEIVDTFSSRLEIRLLTNPHNGGAAVAANLGLKLAKGRYAHFQADDDSVLPQHLQLLRTVLDEAKAAEVPVAVVYGPAFLIRESEDGDVVSRDTIFQGNRPLDALMSANYIVGGTAMFDTGIAQAIGGMNTDYEVLEDWDFWLRMAARAEIIYIDMPTAEYRIRTGITNVSTQARPRFFTSLLKLYDEHPVDPGSAIADQRKAQIELQTTTHSQSYTWDHSVAIIGNGDHTELVACLNSITEVLPGASVQVVVHELRSPTAERLLKDLATDATVCFHAKFDEDLIRQRIARQVGGQYVTVLHSTDRLHLSTLVEATSL